MPNEIKDVLARQEGVISRRQVLAAGGDDDFVESRVRRKDWARLHRGVYVDHTGVPTWQQRAWGAVLFYWPAALCSRSAIRAVSGPREDDERPILVAVDHTRRVRRVPGIEVVRVRRLAEHVQPNRLPYRVRVEHALLHAASAAPSDSAALAVLADACQRGTTTAGRLADTLARQSRLPRRRFLSSVLDDVATGTYSVLEHRYLTGVERPHGLPTGRRQRRVDGGRTTAYRDVDYVGLGAVVELDGRLGHELAEDRWRDVDRDLESLLSGTVTLRLSWSQVLDPCRTAGVVARLLLTRGWGGTPRSCGPACGALFGDRGALSAAVAAKAPRSRVGRG